jgi:ankyrin repeat protein
MRFLMSNTFQKGLNFMKNKFLTSWRVGLLIISSTLYGPENEPQNIFDVIINKARSLGASSAQITQFVNSRHRNGETSLHAAARLGETHRKECATTLLKHGAQINIKDDGGDTPLHKAVLHNHYDMAVLLCEKGADTNIRNNALRTPVQIAIQNDNASMLELLVRYGGKIYLHLPEDYTLPNN